MGIKSLILAGLTAFALATRAVALPQSPSDETLEIEDGLKTISDEFLEIQAKADYLAEALKDVKAVKLFCTSVGCPTKTRELNTSWPMPPHSCPRDAIVALANWRMFCDQRAVKPAYCWTRAPSIDRCCGRWSPGVVPGLPHPMKKGKKIKNGEGDDAEDVYEWIPDTKRVIYPGWADYYHWNPDCRHWRTTNDDQYRYFMQTLDLYGVEDVDETGKVLNSDTDRWDAEGDGNYPLEKPRPRFVLPTT